MSDCNVMTKEMLYKFRLHAKRAEPRAVTPEQKKRGEKRREIEDLREMRRIEKDFEL